jgi:hypothetical protein
MNNIKVKINKGNGWELQEISNPFEENRYSITFFFKGKNRKYIAYDTKLGITYTAFYKKTLFKELDWLMRN